MKNNKTNKMFSLDLELNKSLDTNEGGRTTDIIQIGGCVLDTDTGEIGEKFNRYISLSTPMENGELRLSKFIIKLTGITDERIKSEGIPLEHAVGELYDFCKKEGVARQGLQWGFGDFEELEGEFKKFGGNPEKWFFGRTHFDVKKLHQSIQISRGEKTRSGLSKSMTKYGLNFCGRKHDALDDAINTAILYQYFIDRMRKLGV